MSTRALFPVLALAALPAIAACSAQAPETPADPVTGEAAAAEAFEDPTPGGSFSCDFGLASSAPISEIPGVIERDRMLMAWHPGMITKQLPISFDASGDVYSGGRYLFDTYDHARSYADFVEHGYVLDGVQFLDRPYFLSPDCHAWRVTGARSFSPIEDQVVMRTERFRVPGHVAAGQLRHVFEEAEAEAARRGLGAVWLVSSEDEGLAQIVSYGRRVAPPDPSAPDFASLDALAASPSLGDAVAPGGWTRVFDRSQWVFTVWFPFVPGDRGIGVNRLDIRQLGPRSSARRRHPWASKWTGSSSKLSCRAAGVSWPASAG